MTLQNQVSYPSCRFGGGFATVMVDVAIGVTMRCIRHSFAPPHPHHLLAMPRGAVTVTPLPPSYKTGEAVNVSPPSFSPRNKRTLLPP